jgi:MFS family permease
MQRNGASRFGFRPRGFADLSRRLGPALAEREFRLWWLASVAMNVGLQMIDVAIGWQVYAEHHRTLDLGLIGLAEFVPMFLLVLPAGHLADHRPRRTVVAASLGLTCAVAAGLAVLSVQRESALVPYLLLALAAGTAMAFQGPASVALAPALVRGELLRSAMTLRTIATRAAAVLGPALGGALFAISAPLTYGVAAAVCLAGASCVLAMRAGRVAASARGDAAPPVDLRTVLDGMRFVRDTPILLGAMALDLLGVLFGGAVALLPVYASSILHVGPAGLGVLRAAPAVGALIGAGVITRRPIGSRVGRRLLVSVAAFGVCILVFGLSHSVALSLVALAASGFADLFNMNVRATISAFATPDALRGRVGAVEMAFVSASNELGAFESGLAASLLGTVPAVVGGGALSILLALIWPAAFPALAGADRLEDLTPQRGGARG